MGFITPPWIIAIAAGITIPTLVSLYFLKLKRKRMVIPSTLLWQRAVQDLQVNAPFQRIRNNLLLWVQLLLLLALLIAMARPTQHALADPGRRVVLVIDQSGSMNTTDLDRRSRLDVAKERALQVVDNLDAGGQDGGASGAMVVAFGRRAVVLQDFTTDLARVRKAIRGIEPTDQSSQLGTAIAAVEPHARQADGDDKLYVHVFSDGRVSEATDGPLALANAEVRYHRLGRSAEQGDNLAIAALSARRDYDKPQVVEVFTRLVNYSDQPITTHVSFTADNRVIATKEVTIKPIATQSDKPGTLPAPGEVGLTFDMTWPGDALLTVRHDHADLLAADNIARTVLAPARELRVLMVGPGNLDLQRVCESVGVERFIHMTPEQYERQDPRLLRRGGWDDADVTGAAGPTEQGFDVILFDRYAPRQAPLINSLYFGVVPPLEGLERRDTRPDSPPNELISQWDRASELLSNVELSDIPLRRPGRLIVPVDGRVLAVGREGPVMAEVTRDAVRHVIIGFELHESLWPLRISFLVFFENALSTLGLDGAADEAGVAYRAGENAVIVADRELENVKYTGPATVTGRAVGTTLTIDAFPRAGLYQTDADVPARYKQLAVNLLDAAESDPRIAETLRIGTSSVAGQARAVEVRQEIWPWFVWGALGLLLVEWLVYTRRMHI